MSHTREADDTFALYVPARLTDLRDSSEERATSESLIEAQVPELRRAEVCEEYTTDDENADGAISSEAADDSLLRASAAGAAEDQISA